MASQNPFDLLVDDDVGDTSALLAAYEQKLAAAAAPASDKKAPAGKNAAANNNKSSAKLPSKPAPPSSFARGPRNEGGRGGYGNGYERSHGAGRLIPNTNTSSAKENGFAVDEIERKTYVKRSGSDDFRGGRRGGASNGDFDGERPKRNYERHSGTGRGSEFKRDGAGRGNWGSTTEPIALEAEELVAENEVNVAAEKPAGEEEIADAEKEIAVKESEEKEAEEKQMTLEEYEKVLEEKRKELLALNEDKKGSERKVNVEEFQSMQLVSKKKNDDEVFIKLGTDKDRKRDAVEREEKAKKSVNLTEFLKPKEGEGSYRSGGRGRGRGGRGGGRYGGGGGYAMNNVSAPPIEDQRQFPTLGGK